MNLQVLTWSGYSISYLSKFLEYPLVGPIKLSLSFLERWSILSMCCLNISINLSSRTFIMWFSLLSLIAYSSSSTLFSLNTFNFQEPEHDYILTKLSKSSWSSSLSSYSASGINVTFSSLFPGGFLPVSFLSSFIVGLAHLLFLPSAPLSSYLDSFFLSFFLFFLSFFLSLLESSITSFMSVLGSSFGSGFLFHLFS